MFFLLGTGLRLSEMLSLNIADMDLESGAVQVIGKGNKERHVSMDDDVIEAIKIWLSTRWRVLGGRSQEAVFISRSGGRMGKTFGQNVKEAGRRAGFYCTPHVLRHSFSTQFILAGGDSTVLKDILGHPNICITEQYVHLAKKDFRKAVDQ